MVWLDAHGDFSEPASAVFGYFDGMGLAVLTGSAWQTLRSAVLPEPVAETAIVLAGRAPTSRGADSPAHGSPRCPHRIWARPKP